MRIVVRLRWRVCPYAVAVGGRHEGGTQAVRTDRLCQRAFQSGLGCTLEQDLADRVRHQAGGLDSAAAVDLAEQRAG